MGTETTIKSANDFANKQEYWLTEIEAAEKSTDEWRERGKKIVKISLDKRDAIDNSKRWFQLFAANTNILQSALFQRVPRPEVNRRFKDYSDQVGRVAGLILERALAFELESDGAAEGVFKNIIQDRLKPGAGVGWVRYTMDQEESGEVESAGEDSGEMITDDRNELSDDVGEKTFKITDERTPIDYVHWQDFFWSPARTWEEVRWVARRVYLDYDALVDRFGQEKADKIGRRMAERDNKAEQGGVSPKNQILEQAEIFEVWCKASKTVYWICKDYPEVLDQVDDPTQYPDFFPTPRPLFANLSTNELIPTPDYILAQDQYEELNQINNRISLLIEALRVVGVYDKKNDAVRNMLSTAAENQLIAVDNWAMFAEQGGIQGVVDFLPIDQIIVVVQKLQEARDVIKGQIYELTGISDIIRGVSTPYATATAEGIKSQYASLRLQTLQQEVAEYFSHLIRLKAHLMCRFYEPQRLVERAGRLPVHDQQYIGPAVTLLKSQNGAREFSIVVSVDSLQQPDWQVEKQAKTEALQSISFFLKEAVPAATQIPELAELLMSLLKFGVSGFKAGREVEGVIEDAVQRLLASQKQAQAQKNQPSPQEQEMKLRAELEQAKLQLEQSKVQLEQFKVQSEAQVEQEKLAMDKIRLRAELDANDSEVDTGGVIPESNKITKEEFLMAMQAQLHAFQAGLQALANAPLPEQTIDVVKTADGGYKAVVQ